MKRLFVVLGALLAWYSAASAQVSGVTYVHAPIAWQGQTGEAEFRIAGDTAVLTLRLADGTVVPVRMVTDVRDALPILSDPRLAFAWQPLLDWAGQDLTGLRDRSLARLRLADSVGLVAAAPRGDAERNAGDWRLSATLHFASALAHSGERQESFDLLRQRIAAAPTSADLSYMRQFLTVRESALLFDAGRDVEAVALLEEARRDTAMAKAYRLNLDANLAMMLARTGSSQRALMTVDDAWRTWNAQADETDSAVKLSSGAASFGWIKACALAGLGKRAAAEELLAKIEPVTGADTATDANADARIHAAYCMKDPKFLARELTKLLEDPWPSADILAEVQINDGDRPTDRAVLAEALLDPALAAAIAKHVRVLPVSMRPALSGWVPPLDAAPSKR